MLEMMPGEIGWRVVNTTRLKEEATVRRVDGRWDGVAG